jgi:hypothetical protein
MTHTLTLRKREKNSAGEFSDAESTSGLKGFVEYGTNLKIEKYGEEIKVKAIIFLKNNCEIDVDYEYWMIDQTAPYIRSNMEVLEIYPIDDPRTGQTHHFELAVR